MNIVYTQRAISLGVRMMNLVILKKGQVYDPSAAIKVNVVFKYDREDHVVILMVT